MEKVLLDRVINTDYGQFDLVWNADGDGFDGIFDHYFTGHLNGLVGVSDSSGIYIHFGRRSGGSPVRIILREGPPTSIDPEWEDVVEVSFVLPDGHEMQWASWAGMNWGKLDGVASGSYRMRVSAMGRDQGRDDEFSEQLLDSYLIELWSASVEPDAILRAVSDDGQFWHREIGSRR
ncbi:hypothetical protein ACX80D_04525 [Arthrobacter sp. Sr24]